MRANIPASWRKAGFLLTVFPLNSTALLQIKSSLGSSGGYSLGNTRAPDFSFLTAVHKPIDEKQRKMPVARAVTILFPNLSRQ